MEIFDYLEALARDQDSFKGKPPHSGSLYNLTVRFMPEQWLITIAGIGQNRGQGYKDS